MGDAFSFEHYLAFSPENAEALLRTVPAAPGVFALRGADPAAEPYLTRAADLRRRLRRLLAPPEAVDAAGRPVLSKRLNLRERVRSIQWTRTGSEFESALTLYCATRSAFGAEQARKRMRLYAPYFLRVTATHQHPRVYATNRLSRRALAETFGPFPSRAAAERYGDAVLDLFKLRRCYEDLVVHPDHPGCAYGEMNKCLAPCKTACTAEDYAAEAARVLAFFRTRGESMLAEVAAAREAASERMDFEAAAALHRQWEKVRAAALLADELVRPVAELRALVLQETTPRAPASAQDGGAAFSLDVPALEPADAQGSSAFTEGRTEDAAVFLLQAGRLVGPERLSTLGVRAVREQTAVGSSLFAQPLMLAAVPLAESATAPGAPPSSTAAPPTTVGIGGGEPSTALQGALSFDQPTPHSGTSATHTPEDRARAAIAALEAQTGTEPDAAEFCDFLSLFRRWYYRPEKQRQGEVFLPNPDGSWPARRLLNGAARVVLGPPVQADAVNREAAREALKAQKTKVIHEGREGVERVVPVLPKRSRSRKAVLPADVRSGL